MIYKAAKWPILITGCEWGSYLSEDADVGVMSGDDMESLYANSEYGHNMSNSYNNVIPTKVYTNISKNLAYIG